MPEPTTPKPTPKTTLKPTSRTTQSSTVSTSTTTVSPPTTIKTTKLVEMIHSDESAPSFEEGTLTIPLKFSNIRFLGKPTQMPVAKKPVPAMSEKGKHIKDVEISFMRSAEQHEQEEERKEEEEKPQLYGAKILVIQKTEFLTNQNLGAPNTSGFARRKRA
jgi:hypothetical protein